MLMARAELEQRARAEFMFLKTERGFTQRLKTERSAWFTSFIFRNKKVGVEIGLDYFDNYVSAKLIKLIDGKLPSTQLPTREGMLSWYEVAAILQRCLRINDPLLREIQHLWKGKGDAAYARLALAKYQMLLANYIELINQQEIAVLFPLSDQFFP
jgi:hypothetical protein